MPLQAPALQIEDCCAGSHTMGMFASEGQLHAMQELTGINDNRVQQASQALPAQLLKQHGCIEDDCVDALHMTYNGISAWIMHE